VAVGEPAAGSPPKKRFRVYEMRFFWGSKEEQWKRQSPKSLLSCFLSLVCVNVLKVHAVCVGNEVRLNLQVNAILFDMFDTLMIIERNHAFYSTALHAAYRFLAKNGLSIGFKDFERAYVSARDALYLEADAQLEEPHFNMRIADALRRLGYDCGISDGLVVGATNAFCEAFMKYVSIDENAEHMLLELHGKYKLGIVSNFAIPECVTKLLQRQGLVDFFDVVVVSGAVNKRKPSVEIFMKALKQLDVSATETIFVGDTVDADVQGAKAAGMRTIYVERRPQSNAQKAGPTQTIKSLKELPMAIERC
jgi:HAD superfamily hydrolase (TIGR01662 family)